MEYVKMPNGYWDFKKCKKEAKKHKSITAFENATPGAYASVRKNGWHDKVCSHMKNPLRVWTLSKCKRVAKKYKHKVDFEQGSSSAYSASMRYGWHSEVCAHMVTKEKPLKWSKENCQKEANKYNTVSKFRKGCISAYIKSRNNGWLSDMCVHMVSI